MCLQLPRQLCEGKFDQFGTLREALLQASDLDLRRFATIQSRYTHILCVHAQKRTCKGQAAQNSVLRAMMSMCNLPESCRVGTTVFFIRGRAVLGQDPVALFITQLIGQRFPLPTFLRSSAPALPPQKSERKCASSLKTLNEMYHVQTHSAPTNRRRLVTKRCCGSTAVS